MTTYWTRCTRRFARELKLAGEQVLEALFVHNQHDQIHTFDSDLQSGAPTAHRDECRGAPTIRSAAGGYATSVLAANNEAAFDQVGHYQDALGTAQYFFRNALVRRCHDRAQNFDGRLQPCNRIFASRAGPSVGSNHTHKTH